MMTIKALTSSALGLSLLSSSLYALNPVMGIYTHIGGGVGYTPNVTTTNSKFTLTTGAPDPIIKLDNKILVDGFLGFGYRQENYRLELEVLGAGNNLKNIYITTNGSTLKLNDSSASGDKITFEGKTYLIGVMANAYYQFFQTGQQSPWMPYLGGGIGYGRVKTRLNLVCNPNNSNANYSYATCNSSSSDNSEIPGTKVSTSASTAVGQIIAGASYFMDDYSTISIDYRFTTTGNLKALDARYQMQTLNLSFNFAMDNFFNNV